MKNIPGTVLDVSAPQKPTNVKYDRAHSPKLEIFPASHIFYTSNSRDQYLLLSSETEISSFIIQRFTKEATPIIRTRIIY